MSYSHYYRICENGCASQLKYRIFKYLRGSFSIFEVLEGLDLQEIWLGVFNWAKVVNWPLHWFGALGEGKRRMIDGKIFNTKRNNESFFIHLLSNFFEKPLYFYFSRKNCLHFGFFFFFFLRSTASSVSFLWIWSVSYCICIALKARKTSF